MEKKELEVPVVESPVNQTDETTTETPHAAVGGTGEEPVEQEQGDWFPSNEYEEDWTPLPEEFYTAIIRRKSGGFLILSLSNGDEVFVSVDAITNLPQNHSCLLRTGDPAVVRIQRNGKQNPRWKAIEAILEGDYKVQTKERATVRWWDKTQIYGMVSRPCGCWIFVLSREPINLEKGDDVIVSRFMPSRNKNHPGTIAGAIEIETNFEEGERL